MRWFPIWLVLCCCVIAAASPLEKDVISASARWVVHLDVQGFSKTLFGQMFLEDIRKQHQLKLDSLTQLVGSDLTRDIYGLTLFGPDANETNAVLLLSCRYDKQKLLAVLALNAHYAETQHGDRTLYHWQDPHRGKSQVGAFVSDSLIAISQSEKAILEILDVTEQRGLSLSSVPSHPLSQLFQVNSEAFFVAGADDLATLTQSSANAAILRNSRFIAVLGEEKEQQMRLQLFLEAQSMDAAKQIELVARGILAFAMLQEQKNPVLSSLASAWTIYRTDHQLLLEFIHPSSGLFEKLKQLSVKDK